jgi:hypothetical protein
LASRKLLGLLDVCSMELSVLPCILLCARRPQTGLTQIVAKADKMFENNAKDKGGSVYLQSKVLNAKDCLSIHLGEEIQENPMEPKTAASEAGDSDTDNKPQP